MNKRFIITGGPGSGKSTLLEALIEEGYSGFEEISRVVIKEQHQSGGDKLPWANLKDFAEICYQRMCIQLDECKPGNICFYDRGLPDIIAYMKRGKLEVPQHYYDRCKNYNSIVFLAPNWKEIFINDSERPESYEDACEIYQFLKETYIDLGFQVMELPKVSVNERVEFIRHYTLEANDSETA